MAYYTTYTFVSYEITHDTRTVTNILPSMTRLFSLLNWLLTIGYCPKMERSKNAPPQL